MKGPVMFGGYYKRPDKTAECHDENGWFTTGDVVQMYPNGSLKIIDRSKNIFKLSQGEYIAPEKVEGIFCLSSFVAQCLVYGDSFKNSCVSVVIPEQAVVEQWAKENGVQGDFEALCQNADLKKALVADLAELAVKNKLSTLEKPKDFYLSHDPFTPDNDCLTATFKLKRH